MVECLFCYQVFEGKIGAGVSLAIVIAGLFQGRGSDVGTAKSACMRPNLLIVADHLSAGAISAPTMDDARLEMEVNYFGHWQ